MYVLYCNYLCCGFYVKVCSFILCTPYSANMSKKNFQCFSQGTRKSFWFWVIVKLVSFISKPVKACPHTCSTWQGLVTVSVQTLSWQLEAYKGGEKNNFLISWELTLNHSSQLETSCDCSDNPKRSGSERACQYFLFSQDSLRSVLLPQDAHLWRQYLHVVLHKVKVSTSTKD